MNKQTRRKLLDGLFNIVGAPLLVGILRIMAWINRFDWQNRQIYDQALASGRPLVFVFWHEDMISIALACLRVQPGSVAVMVSRSRDGEKLARVLRCMGMEPVRGSSSRGAIAGVVKLCRYLTVPISSTNAKVRKRSTWAAIALDGPRGPRRIAKPGVALIARKTHALLLPVAFAHTRQITFGSWDRTRFPLPFARCLVRFSPLLDIQDWAGDDHTFGMMLQTTLNGLHNELETSLRQNLKKSIATGHPNKNNIKGD